MATTSDDASSANEQQQQQQYPIAMSEAERYLFDLNGYIIIRDVLTPDQIAAAHAAIDAHLTDAIPRSDPTLRNAVEGSPMYGSGPPRLDLGGIFEWGSAESEVFKSILAHPRLAGKGSNYTEVQSTVSPVTTTITWPTPVTMEASAPHYWDATSCLSITIPAMEDSALCLDHTSPTLNARGDGGWDHHSEYIQQPATKAGDVVLFSEGTVHGAMGWQSDIQRRCALYRFAPATCGYGRSYFSPDGVGGATTTLHRLPPYANRLDRPNIREDGSVEITQRSDRKRQHDKEVFKTKYF
ncbi:PhyH family protein [Skeletonema marinoi]|uniref:PhyH family protein n=1 Tax=Skeletonema marinoi TaxID=267567 RepID=A0AAD8YG94_9STRA|nr:PhyH family protein [Skeletonema marinoi]